MSNSKMKTKLGIRLLMLVALAASASVAARADNPPALSRSNPNIIQIMPDDAGYGDYACLGSPIMRTPSVDAFKQENQSKNPEYAAIKKRLNGLLPTPGQMPHGLPSKKK